MGLDAQDATRLLGGALPFWDRSLDVVVLTHGHADHITGLLDVLRRYDVEHIVEREAEYATPAYVSWRRAIENEATTATQAQAGHIINLGDGATIEVLHPSETLMAGTDSDLNNASIVLRVVYGDVSFLLTGDVFVEAEGEMLSRGARTYAARSSKSRTTGAGRHPHRSSSSRSARRLR